jgi:RTX calcium-binding nonapeptide repeat (4 copies)
VRCPLGPVPAEQLRLRISLGDGRESATADQPPLRAVVYAGNGDDFVGADRVYGGRGNDFLGGRRVYGGPGADNIEGVSVTTGRRILFGGPGNDELRAPGRLYGGPGDDDLGDLFVDPSADMLVGGPGHDRVRLYGDGRADVVRLRGGGTDRVVCGDPPARDVLFVDHTDRVSPSCKTTRVLLTGRPRYPYP